LDGKGAGTHGGRGAMWLWGSYGSQRWRWQTCSALEPVELEKHAAEQTRFMHPVACVCLSHEREE